MNMRAIWSFIVAAGAAFTAPAMAAYDSDGFDDADRFVAHTPLESQDEGAWLSAAGPTTTAYIRDGALAPAGSVGQVVEVFRGAHESGEWYVPNGITLAPSHSAVAVEWSMYVEHSGSRPEDFFGFGPMFGLFANNEGAAFTRLGGVFVDAYDGRVLVTDSTVAGGVVASDMSVALDTWNSFRMVLDFAASPGAAVRLYLNGSTAPFYSDDFAAALVAGSDVSGITDAAIYSGASAIDAESASITGYAYFDDYRVTALPEPASLLLLGMGTLLALKRGIRKVSW